MTFSLGNIRGHRRLHRYPKLQRSLGCTPTPTPLPGSQICLAICRALQHAGQVLGQAPRTIVTSCPRVSSLARFLCCVFPIPLHVVGRTYFALSQSFSIDCGWFCGLALGMFLLRKRGVCLLQQLGGLLNLVGLSTPHIRKEGRKEGREGGRAMASVAQLFGLLSHSPKGCRFYIPSGRKPKLRVRSPIRATD